MKQTAIELATARLARAERALEELSAAKSYSDAEEAWSDFLIASNGIYAKLEQGAKGGGRSEAWFGRKKRERANDPVLRYLHHARNCEEHGLELVTSRQPDGGNQMGFGERSEWIIQEYDPTTGRGRGEESTAWMYGPHVKLVPVRDRGVLYEPPYAFVDPPGEPHAAGLNALLKLRGLLDEAATFVTG